MRMTMQTVRTSDYEFHDYLPELEQSREETQEAFANMEEIGQRLRMITRFQGEMARLGVCHE